MTESMDIQYTHEPLSTPSTPGDTGERVRELRPQASEQALALLDWIVRRSHRTTGLALTEEFIRRDDTGDPPPPLAQMLRGGRGGEVRLKLYLTISLLAVSPPYDIEQPVPARVWAEVLDLADSDRNGARRVNDAIDWLAEHKFLVSERRRGKPGAIRLLSQAGTGEPYTRPAGAKRFVKLPLGLWQRGWIVQLSGSALALLVILLDMQGGRSKASWISPTQARRRYDLSTDTWTKGIAELGALGIVSVSRKPQGEIFDYRRMRNAYWVNEELLIGSPPPGAGPRRRRTAPARTG